jgi:hypothetical protein
MNAPHLDALALGFPMVLGACTASERGHGPSSPDPRSPEQPRTGELVDVRGPGIDARRDGAEAAHPLPWTRRGPAWSPDGRHIVFSSVRDDCAYAEGEDCLRPVTSALPHALHQGFRRLGRRPSHQDLRSVLGVIARRRLHPVRPVPQRDPAGRDGPDPGSGWRAYPASQKSPTGSPPRSGRKTELALRTRPTALRGTRPRSQASSA